MLRSLHKFYRPYTGLHKKIVTITESEHEYLKAIYFSISLIQFQAYLHLVSEKVFNTYIKPHTRLYKKLNTVLLLKTISINTILVILNAFFP